MGTTDRAVVKQMLSIIDMKCVSIYSMPSVGRFLFGLLALAL
jgi:hypothetical protein